MPGWSEGNKEYCCVDGGNISIKRQNTVRFMGKQADKNSKENALSDVLLAIGPKNGLVSSVSIRNAPYLKNMKLPIVISSLMLDKNVKVMLIADRNTQ